MTQVTVKELAKAVNTPVESLLQQMHEAGLAHTSADQKVSDTEKQTLLTFLEKGTGSKADGSKKITLQRKTTTTLRAPGSKTISVEVRKKRTYVKRNTEEVPAVASDEPVKTAEPVAKTQQPTREQMANIVQEAEQRRIEAVEQARQKEAEAKAAREAEELARQQQKADEAPVTPVAEPVLDEPPVVRPERKKEETRRSSRRDED